MTTTLSQATPGCVTNAPLFQHPVVEDGVAPAGPAQAQMLAKPTALCATCPLAQRSLFDAVTRHDVSGFVAGTTAQQRRQIRARLGVRVRQENLDTVAGTMQANHPVDRDEVVRLRRANPDETLEQIAMRLGCSTSTVKRHLRKVRNGVASKPESVSSLKLTVEEVWTTAQTVKRRVARRDALATVA